MFLGPRHVNQALRRRTENGETPIDVAYPAAEGLDLQIALGARRSVTKAGEGGAWVAGICHDPTGKRSLRVLEL